MTTHKKVSHCAFTGGYIFTYQPTTKLQELHEVKQFWYVRKACLSGYFAEYGYYLDLMILLRLVYDSNRFLIIDMYHVKQISIKKAKFMHYSQLENWHQKELTLVSVGASHDNIWRQ